MRSAEIISVLLLFVLVAGAGYGIVRKHVTRSDAGEVRISSDVISYVDAAKRMLEGKDIYFGDAGEKTSYVYPPFLGFLCIPLTRVHPLTIDVFWYVLNVFLVAVCIRLAHALFVSESFSALSWKGQWLLGGLTLLFSFRYLLRNFVDANVNLLVLASIVVAVYLVQTTGKPAWATVIGVAGAIKIFPLLFVVYFAGKRMYREIIYLALGFVGALALPSALVGVDRNIQYLVSFVTYGQTQLSPVGLEIENFSLWGTLGRLFSESKAFDAAPGVPVFLNVASVDLSLLKWAVIITNVLMVLMVYVVARKEQNGRINNGGFVVTLLAMNLVSILVEDHHVVGFMLAFLFLLLALRRGVVGGLWFASLVTGLGLASALISYDVIVPLLGKAAYMIMLSYSLPVLYVGIGLLLLTLHSMRRSVAAVHTVKNIR